MRRLRNPIPIMFQIYALEKEAAGNCVILLLWYCNILHVMLTGDYIRIGIEYLNYEVNKWMNAT